MECPHCKEQSPIMGEIPKDIWKMVIKLKLAQQVEQEKWNVIGVTKNKVQETHTFVIVPVIISLVHDHDLR